MTGMLDRLEQWSKERCLSNHYKDGEPLDETLKQAVSRLKMGPRATLPFLRRYQRQLEDFEDAQRSKGHGDLGAYHAGKMAMLRILIADAEGTAIGDALS